MDCPEQADPGTERRFVAVGGGRGGAWSDWLVTNRRVFPVGRWEFLKLTTARAAQLCHQWNTAGLHTSDG